MMKTLTVGALEVNCYILSDDSSKEAVIIDPGADAEAIMDVVKKTDSRSGGSSIRTDI